MTSSSNTVRRGGIATITAGALFVMGALIPFDVQESLSTVPGGAPPSLSGYLILASNGIAYLLLLGGLAGLRVLHAGRYDRAGRAGLRLARFGVIVGGAYSVVVIVTELAFPDAQPPVLALLPVGLVVGAGVLAVVVGEWYLGIATLRARVLRSPWRALPMVAFALDVLPFIALLLALAGIYDLGGGLFPTLTGALWGLAWLLVGYALWSGRVEEGYGEEQEPHDL